MVFFVQLLNTETILNKPDNDKLDKLITFRLKGDIKAKADNKAKADGRSLANWLRRVVENEVKPKKP